MRSFYVHLRSLVCNYWLMRPLKLLKLTFYFTFVFSYNISFCIYHLSKFLVHWVHSALRKTANDILCTSDKFIVHRDLVLTFLDLSLLVCCKNYFNLWPWLMISLLFFVDDSPILASGTVWWTTPASSEPPQVKSMVWEIVISAHVKLHSLSLYCGNYSCYILYAFINL